MSDTLYARLNQPHRDNLIWLRLFAAVMVIYGHSYALSPQVPMQFDLIARALPGTYAGAFGVDLFFLLSGILITHSWSKTTDVWRFASARIRRIYPGLLVCTALSALVLGPLMSTLSVSQYFGNLQWLYYWLGNGTLYSMSYQLPGVFAANPYPIAVNGSLWSLKIEVMCYAAVLIAGLVVRQMARHGAQHIAQYRLLAKALLGILLVLCALALLSPPTGLFKFSPEVPRAVGYFALGAALSVNAQHIRLSVRWWLIVLPLAWVAANYLDPNQLPAAVARACFLTAFLMLCGYCLKPLRPPVFGDASYGLYLYGFPVQQSLMQLFPQWSPLQLTFPSAALALLCGIASFHLVEQRFLKRS
jgi:peptidoglycan/LPS O-acetylase OafA/YrhL